jgi:hypothetical protein
MQPGLVLQHNKPTSVTVSLAPSTLTNDGAVNGKLEFILDSCLTTYTVNLTATNVVVSVDDDQALPLDIVVDDGAIFIRASEGTVHVYDARGGVVAKTTLHAADALMRRQVAGDLANGSYVVVFQGQQGSPQLVRSVIVIR